MAALAHLNVEFAGGCAPGPQLSPSAESWKPRASVVPGSHGAGGVQAFNPSAVPR